MESASLVHLAGDLLICWAGPGMGTARPRMASSWRSAADKAWLPDRTFESVPGKARREDLVPAWFGRSSRRRGCRLQ